MKKLILFVVCVFFTHTTFAQSERDQKINKKVERDNPLPPQNTKPPQSVIVQPTPYYNPYYNPYRNTYPLYQRYNRPSVIIPPQPLTYQNNPRRESNVDFGLMTTLGFYNSSRPTIGLRGTLGGENYYGIFGWEASARNPYSHYNNISILDVEGWDDESIGKFTTTNTLELGIGINITKGLYTTVIGYGTTKREYLAFMDEEYVLSPNGKYSINGQTKTLNGLQIGMSYRSKRTITSMDLGLLGPKRLSMGIGLIL